MRTVLVIAIALACTVPAATATWFTQGSYEPDNAHDMAETSNPRAVNRNADARTVYFDVYPTNTFLGVNPNGAGQVNGGHVFSPGTLHFNAVLGAWADCNHDDYVGAAEMALFTYRIEVLQAYEAAGGFTSECTAANGHVIGGWVYEMITIGSSTGDADQAPGTFFSSAQVWGDAGLPGGPQGTSCVLTPVPHGTTASSGGAIQYIDCILNHQIANAVNSQSGTTGISMSTSNAGCDPGPTAGGANIAPPETVFGRQCDANGDGETGALQLDSGQDDTDTDKSDKAAFYVVDCGGTPAATPTADPTASFADGANQTFDAVASDCDDSTDNELSSEWHVTVGLLDGGAGSGSNNAASKQSAEVQFLFNDGQRPSRVPAAGADTGTQPVFDATIGSGAPDYMGVQPLNRLVAGSEEAFLTPPTPVPDEYGYGWAAFSVFITTPQTINRNTLQPSNRAYYTFYADVGAEAKSAGFVVPADKLYGAEVCQGQQSGVHGPAGGQWDCTAANWYTQTGTDPSTLRYSPRVHQPFQMRDYDCFDGEVIEGSDVRASLVDLSANGPCDHIGVS